MDPLSDSHLSNIRLCCRKLLLHLSQPEFHSVVDYLNWSSLHNTCCHGGVPEVFTGINETLIVEADCASVYEASLDQGFAQLPSGLELFRILIITITFRELPLRRQLEKPT